ncbi:hypothetical protein NLM33_46460 [Bradyrhizobium sp. CCGUVB1N3]|uniref:hypothetical protein n=1 Tax=Bradyrhizobium sp. CCGUVB1N3 TaxID=2949629 RepID=UPI0020B240D7|nr:hypothetical protein [Bradyrhizobium sp. CCGUVB1N3]MCP3477602.1 hypothetical protein [Bradyrhizobium sp. CCGUVB1N3]
MSGRRGPQLPAAATGHLGGDALALAGFDRGRDEFDLLATEIAAVIGVQIDGDD